MRLFTALDLSAEVLRNLEKLLDELRPVVRIGWSAPSNLHITTKFIGQWSEDRLEELKRELAGVRVAGPIEVSIRKLGFFPNPHSPRVFFCGIEAPGLDRLAKETEAATARLGIESEKRAYSPHLTLARIKERVQLQPLREKIAGLASQEFGGFTAGSYFLYQSQLRSSGSVYTKLAEFRFFDR